MEKLSEKQTPNYEEMRKTLVGLGNVLIQADLADGISCTLYRSIGDFSFKCGKFEYQANTTHPYDEAEYLLFVKSIEDFMMDTIKDYEERIFAMECNKAIMEIYLNNKKEK